MSVGNELYRLKKPSLREAGQINHKGQNRDSHQVCFVLSHDRQLLGAWWLLSLVLAKFLGAIPFVPCDLKVKCVCVGVCVRTHTFQDGIQEDRSY